MFHLNKILKALGVFLAISLSWSNSFGMTFAQILGNHQISFCDYYQNFEKKADKYYCEFKTLTVSISPDSTNSNDPTKKNYTVVFKDQAGRKFSIPTLKEFHVATDSIIEDAHFVLTQNSIRWEHIVMDRTDTSKTTDSYEFQLTDPNNFTALLSGNLISVGKNKTQELPPLNLTKTFSYISTAVSQFDTWNFNLN